MVFLIITFKIKHINLCSSEFVVHKIKSISVP